MVIPTVFKWPHQWNDEWKQPKIICAKHFGLDLHKPERQSESIIFHYIFPLCFLSTFLACIPTLETYGNKLADIVPILVSATEAVQDKLQLVFECELAGTLPYQV